MKVGTGCRGTANWLEIEAREAKLREVEELAQKKWLKEVRRITSTLPTGVIGPLPGKVGTIYCSQATAYIVLRYTSEVFPRLPLWYIASKGKYGLKGFFDKSTTGAMLRGLVGPEGELPLEGSIKIVGVSSSGKSVHCYLVKS